LTRRRIQNTEEEKRLDVGNSYRIVEAQSENRTGEKRSGTDLLTEFVQGRVEVLKTLFVIVPVNFWSVKSICRSTW
jgi:hypothetical protein